MSRSSSAAPRRVLAALVLAAVAPAAAQDPASAEEGPVAVADPAELAFEAGRWEEAIAEYRELLADYPEDRLALLRIAQAERELGRHEQALATLEQARTANAPEAMIDFERARNLALLGRHDEAIAALESADHSGLRALELLEQAKELDPLRDDRRFRSVYDSVRARVYPCEGSRPARDFDFWLGRWEVRLPDGTLVGHDTVTKRDGGCTVHEHWEGAGGSSGTSVSFYLPSRGEWRQVWSGSGGTFIDMTGRLVDGAMRMEGTLEYAAQDRVVAFRATWTPGPDGRVRQRMEEFDLAAGTWVVWFDGFFRRVQSP
ncbi:MAG TPA: tetratricopeptide repeat protein [Gammaproteobacteria bacterium]